MDRKTHLRPLALLKCRLSVSYPPPSRSGVRPPSKVSRSTTGTSMGVDHASRHCAPSRRRWTQPASYRAAGTIVTVRIEDGDPASGFVAGSIGAATAPNAPTMAASALITGVRGCKAHAARGSARNVDNRFKASSMDRKGSAFASGPTAARRRRRRASSPPPRWSACRVAMTAHTSRSSDASASKSIADRSVSQHAGSCSRSCVTSRQPAREHH